MNKPNYNLECTITVLRTISGVTAELLLSAWLLKYPFKILKDLKTQCPDIINVSYSEKFQTRTPTLPWQKLLHVGRETTGLNTAPFLPSYRWCTCIQCNVQAQCASEGPHSPSWNYSATQISWNRPSLSHHIRKCIGMHEGEGLVYARALYLWTSSIQGGLPGSFSAHLQKVHENGAIEEGF